MIDKLKSNMCILDEYQIQNFVSSRRFVFFSFKYKIVTKKIQETGGSLRNDHTNVRVINYLERNKQKKKIKMMVELLLKKLKREIFVEGVR